jgi:hypothetical protein
MSALDEIERTFPDPPVGASIDWTSVESAVGVALPSDYKAYCQRYPPGKINGLEVLHPHTNERPITEALAWRDEIFRYVRNQVQADPLWPNPAGLLPWAEIDSTPVFCWDTTSAVDPDNWATVVFDSSLHFARFEGSATECIRDLLGGWTVPHIIPSGLGMSRPFRMYLFAGGIYEEAPPRTE